MTQTQSPILQNIIDKKTHDELGYSLRRLVDLRRSRDQMKQEYDRQIAEQELAIERLVFAAFPGISQGVSYDEGDPIEFFAGNNHRVRLYSDHAGPKVEIDRSHTLETEIDLFAEEAVEGAV